MTFEVYRNDRRNYQKHLSMLTSFRRQKPRTVSQRSTCMANKLFNAVVDGRLQQVRFLLDLGVRTNIRNELGQNLLVAALHIEDDKKRDKMFKYLLSKSINCCEQDREKGLSVLSWACRLGRSRQVERILDTALGDINLKAGDYKGLTPLHHAVISNNTGIVCQITKAMDRYRLSVDIPDSDGLTPYIYARKLGHSDLASILETEGKACSEQFDSKTFRMVDEWENIGRAERDNDLKVARSQRISWDKIHGKVRKNNTQYQSTSNMHSPQSEKQVDALWTTKSDGYLLERRHRQNKANDFASKDDVRIPRTLFSLLKMSDDAHHPDHFVSSQFDDTKIDEYRSVMGNLPQMMQVLSDQQSKSYRKTCIPMPEPIKIVETPKIVYKKPKVSTMAIVFGRDRQRRRRKPKLPSRKQKPVPSKKISINQRPVISVASRPTTQPDEQRETLSKIFSSPNNDEGIVSKATMHRTNKLLFPKLTETTLQRY